MKKVFLYIALIFGFILAVLAVGNAVQFELGKMTGAYVAVEAEITDVHEYEQKKNYSMRTNGYFTWEYEGVVHDMAQESVNRIDLVYGDQVGDTIFIWVNRMNGRFVKVNNEYTDRSTILGAVLFVIFYVAIAGVLIYKNKTR